MGVDAGGPNFIYELSAICPEDSKPVKAIKFIRKNRKPKNLKSDKLIKSEGKQRVQSFDTCDQKDFILFYLSFRVVQRKRGYPMV